MDFKKYFDHESFLGGSPLELLFKIFTFFFQKVIWLTLIYTVSMAVIFPHFAAIHTRYWSDRIDLDPLQFYTFDGFAQSIGVKPYLVVHPGTPIHEFVTWMSKLFRLVLFESFSGTAEINRDFVEWLTLFPQTWVSIFQYLQILAWILVAWVLFSRNFSVFQHRFTGLLFLLGYGSQHLINHEWLGRNKLEYFVLPFILVLVSLSRKLIFHKFDWKAWFSLALISALLISFKLNMASTILVFLFFVSVKEPDHPFQISEKFKSGIALFLYTAIPYLVSLLFVYIAVFKRDKIDPAAHGKLYLLPPLLLVIGSSPIVFKKIRAKIGELWFFNLTLFTTFLFFAIINYRLNLKPLVSFVINFYGQGTDTPKLFIEILAAMPDRVLIMFLGFGAGTLGLYTFSKARQELKNEYRYWLILPICVLLSIVSAFRYFRTRAEYFIVADFLIGIFTLQVLEFLIMTVSNRLAWPGRLRPYLLVLAFVVPIMAISRAYQTRWLSLLEINRRAILAFENRQSNVDQGIDTELFYNKQTRRYVEDVNLFTALRLPDETATAAERRDRKLIFLKKYQKLDPDWVIFDRYTEW